MNLGSRIVKVNESKRQLQSTGPKKLIIDYLDHLERKKSIKMNEKVKSVREEKNGKEKQQSPKKIKIQDGNILMIPQKNANQQRTSLQNKVLSQDIINHLGEFIEYFLQNQQTKKRRNELLEQQMKASPLEDFQERLKTKKLLLSQAREQYQRKKREVEFAVKNVQQQEAQIGIQLQQIQEDIEKLKEKHKEKNILNQRVNELKSLVQDEEKKIQLKEEQIWQQCIAHKEHIDKQAQQINQQMRKMKDEMKWVENIQESIKSKKEMLKLQNQVFLSFQFHLQQTIKQKSQKDIKFDILSSAPLDSTNISNKDLLQQVYQRIQKKIEYFKKGIEAHNEKSKFLSFLQLVELEDNRKIKVTKASHQVEGNQKDFLEEFKCQYKVYNQYFAVDQTLRKLREILESVEEKHKEKIMKTREEIQNIKERSVINTNLENQMENTFRIRQAEIKQLQSIVEEQNIKLAKFRQNNSDSNLHIFSSSLSNLKKKTSLFGQ